MAGRGRGRESTLPAWMTQGKAEAACGGEGATRVASQTMRHAGPGGPGPAAPGSMGGPNPQVRPCRSPVHGTCFFGLLT